MERRVIQELRLVLALTVSLLLGQAWLLYDGWQITPGGSFYLYTEPAGARVWKREVSLQGYSEHALGLTPGPVNTRRFQGVLIVRMWGYAEEKIPSSQVDFAAQRYPSKGTLKLVPTTSLAPWLIYLAAWWPIMLLGVVWALAYYRHRALRARLLVEEGRSLRFGAGIVEVGTRIERYEVRGVLGAGGMARVYEVLSLDRPGSAPLALKLLSGQGVEETQRARFLREARLMRECQHPNLVALYDFGEFDGRFFLVMEKVAGLTLDAALRQERPSRGRLLGWVREVASALCYLHGKGLVHRDVKPSNVMIRDDGKVLLMDLGIARNEGPSDLTLEGQVVGTPGYMAPEQIRGQTVDYRADLYSLGVLLYHCLTSRLPFPGETALELMSAQIHQEPTWLSQLQLDLDPRLAQLVDRLLSPEPERRADSPEQVVGELSSFLQGA